VTKKDENNSSDKEVYALWWEYLKRSEKYERFCGLIRKAKENGEYDKSFSDLFAVTEENIEKDGYLMSIFLNHMNNNFEYFGDVFNNSFDDWWNKKRKEKIKQPLQVIDFSDPTDTNAYHMLNSFVESLRNYRNELKKYSEGTTEEPVAFSEEPNRYLYLAIPMVGGVTMEEISKQIADIRKIRKKDFEIDDFYYRRFDMPVSRVRLKEMKHYLEVYDRWKKGMKMKDIISEMAPDRYGENILRSFRSDLQKAKKIIQNVECGSFPEEPDF